MIRGGYTVRSVPEPRTIWQRVSAARVKFRKALYNGRDARAKARSHRALFFYSYRKELTWTRTRSPRPRTT
nr:MAG TPA: hypothetical protein [Bacteriophage sp.]